MIPTRPTAKASATGNSSDRFQADNGAIAAMGISQTHRAPYASNVGMTIASPWRMTAHATISRTRTDQHRTAPHIDRLKESAQPRDPDRAAVLGGSSPITRSHSRCNWPEDRRSPFPVTAGCPDPQAERRDYV